jgi:hypothetical protein
MSMAFLGQVYASAGGSAEVRTILRTLVDRGRKRYAPSYWVALLHVGLGEWDQAFR